MVEGFAVYSVLWLGEYRLSNKLKRITGMDDKISLMPAVEVLELALF